MSQSHTLAEVFSQPETWRETLSLPVPDGLRRDLLTLAVGCGSTHYLALTAAALLRRAGFPAGALPSSELLLAPESHPPLAGTQLLAISRSGTTTETVELANRHRLAGGGEQIVVTCHPDSPLAERADRLLAVPHAAEQSVAQTRSFTNMLLAIGCWVTALGGLDPAPLHRLPDQAEALLKERPTLIDSGVQRFFFLGGGAEYGVACEGMLKMKEMSLTDSEAYHPLEFRHGPMSMADQVAAVVGLIGAERSDAERRVLAEMRSRGASTIEVGPGGDVAFDAPWWARSVLYLVPLQLLALQRAVAKGLDPDQPRHLNAVVELEHI